MTYIGWQWCNPKKTGNEKNKQQKQQNNFEVFGRFVEGMRRRQTIDNTEKSGSTLNMRLPTRSLKENPTDSGASQESGGDTCTNKKSFYSKMASILAWIVILGAFSTVLLRSAFPVYLNVADERFLEIRKCPACFGVLLCPAFLTGEIVPETWSRFRATQYINSKNVYFASFKGKHVSNRKRIILIFYLLLKLIHLLA